MLFRSFDDLIVSRVVRPKIWMAVQPMEEISFRAVELLMDRIRSKQWDFPVKIHFSASIQEGASVKNLKGGEERQAAVPSNP